MTSSTDSTRTWNGRLSRLLRLAAALLVACTAWLVVGIVHADATLNPSLLPGIQSATFEVVAAKPKDTLTYEKPLPLDLLPYEERTDKYYSIGTAFAIGPNTYVTAAHVLMIGYQSLWGAPELRDASGKVYAIDKIEKFALRRDFVVFSLKDPPKITPLALDTKPGLNQVVYSVGNALGTGVVIRNGLYTSDTPESQDGEWKWIRFSAAASPGNSGGPLLDQNGKVIGVVLMKSPNENLNYALPMRDVLDAPKDLARFDRRMAYQFDAFDSTLSGTFKGDFKLPLSLSDFFAAYAKAFHPYLDSQLKALLDQQSANLFPNGDGAQQVLNGGAGSSDFPQILVRNSDGIWAPQGKPGIKTTLPANGYILGGAVGGNMLFHLRKPDNLSAEPFHHDAKGVGPAAENRLHETHGRPGADSGDVARRARQQGHLDGSLGAPLAGLDVAGALRERLRHRLRLADSDRIRAADAHGACNIAARHRHQHAGAHGFREPVLQGNACAVEGLSCRTCAAAGRVQEHPHWLRLRQGLPLRLAADGIFVHVRDPGHRCEQHAGAGILFLPA